jgi:hypothetical protein
MLLIAWQWERVSVTNSVFWVLVQGLRSDLMTLGLFATPAVLLLPVLLAIGRVTWWVRACCVWLGLSPTAIETPRFLTEFDGRLAWLVARHFTGYARDPNRWRASTVLLVWPMVLIVLFVMVRSSFQHRPANLGPTVRCQRPIR